MNQTGQKTTFSIGSTFIKDAVNKGMSVSSVIDIEICKGLYVHFAVAQLSPLLNVEEKAIFGYFPIDDSRAYAQLTFLPESDVNATPQTEILQISFLPEFFEQWSLKQLLQCEPFSIDRSAEQLFSVNAQIRIQLNRILQFKKSKQGFVEILQTQVAALSLLKFAIEAFTNPDEADVMPACGFLSNDAEREKIVLAQKIILENIAEPPTIKELARSCGINECYLKKGFKAIFGKTIYEYREQSRIEIAKDLIVNKQYTINEVATQLGYASHAYFSTVFKRITGIKPCDLLK